MTRRIATSISLQISSSLLKCSLQTLLPMFSDPKVQFRILHNSAERNSTMQLLTEAKLDIRSSKLSASRFDLAFI